MAINTTPTKPDTSQILNIGHMVAATNAEGPGTRFAIWVQGCPLRCPGCCNPELLPLAGGTQYSVQTLFTFITAQSGIEGVSLLGGEPFAQAQALAELAWQCQQHGLSVMVFSGYSLTWLKKQNDHTRKLLLYTDVLVDGVYNQRQPETKRRWIGSTNQQLYFLSDRYHSNDPQFQYSNTIELRLNKHRLLINGWPIDQQFVNS